MLADVAKSDVAKSFNFRRQAPAVSVEDEQAIVSMSKPESEAIDEPHRLAELIK